ncbi:ABC transporter ATP-binding protein [Natronobacterium texcoconense]|uniref:Putative ABC transport system ATP-binding protein n=1 Tax=Natronobacterium texcoconense TaxID=1095778 RepID=A0A1H1FFK6_NATTX|nr:ATP-binding cassette domain-containing protein [Natronobacterium texcoconense]SDQ99519.1 putative ABC transport system ATP-binding protein [Natronobacterium texcoconense]
MVAKLETDSLTRVVDGERIVDAVSLSVHESNVLAVIGSSGAGKSSFLRLLNRLDEPTDGTVYLEGTDYREIEPQELRQRVGFVPQDPALRPGTVRENVGVGDRIRDEPIDDERVRRLLERLQLPGYEDRSVDDLSGGERQRVAIARTLYVDPEVLLLDEPTSHLDTETESKIERLLEELIQTDNLTCVLVTHDTSQAERLGDRVAEFDGGAVVAEGTPEEVIA